MYKWKGGPYHIPEPINGTDYEGHKKRIFGEFFIEEEKKMEYIVYLKDGRSYGFDGPYDDSIETLKCYRYIKDKYVDFTISKDLISHIKKGVTGETVYDYTWVPVPKGYVVTQVNTEKKEITINPDKGQFEKDSSTAWDRVGNRNGLHSHLDIVVDTRGRVYLLSPGYHPYNVHADAIRVIYDEVLDYQLLKSEIQLVWCGKTGALKYNAASPITYMDVTDKEVEVAPLPESKPKLDPAYQAIFKLGMNEE